MSQYYHFHHQGHMVAQCEGNLAHPIPVTNMFKGVI
jgi:hypothetical protein